MSAAGVSWGLRLDRVAVQDLHKLDRGIVHLVWAALNRLVADPDAANVQADGDDPSVYWITVEADLVIHFEILDSEHVLHVLRVR